MQFHHHGYVSTDPRVQPAEGLGLNRSEELPDEMDVLIVGTGPAGMIAAAQLSMFPNINTRIIERRAGRLEIGQADGIQARSVESFQAFGFARQLINEAYWITEMAFWKPNPENPEEIIRTGQPKDDETGISEFPHLIVNQARILDYFAEYMKMSPSRMTPDYGIEFLDLTVDRAQEYPVEVHVRYTAGEREGQERTVRAKYVIGCDGARSGVRRSIGRHLVGDQANHAWGVMDILANTDFPDIRLKCAIQSHEGGNILLIPREGGHLFRMYVDLGEVTDERSKTIRATTIEEIIERANKIIAPYSLDVKSVAWHSVYEVGHRLTDKFDDLPNDSTPDQTPRVFITGDACHTHSAKAGQGMNVSLQDGWNISWKLANVLSGRSPETLLNTYSSERQVIAKNLIDFDKEWSTLMATRQEDLPDPTYLEDFYVKTAEFPAGFMTEYQPSMITGSKDHQELAAGFPVGKRFHSAKAIRKCDANPLEIGHEHTADGRWRIYVFADEAVQSDANSRLNAWAAWFKEDANSPLNKYTPVDGDEDAIFDVKVIYQQRHTEIEVTEAPKAFVPQCGPFKLDVLENVYGVLPEDDIFEKRGISRTGAVVVVRPDQYVSGVFSLEDTAGLAEFFEPVFAK